MEFTDDNMIDLAKGLSKVLGYYHSEGVTSFNLVIYSGPMGKKLDYFSSNLKIVSRFTLPPLNIGDITWRQRLMNRYEALMASPEPMASDLRKAFQ